MNEAAYIDGYLNKTALSLPGSSIGSTVGSWLTRPVQPAAMSPEELQKQLPNERMFTSPAAQKIAPHLGENAYLADPYQPQAKPWIETKMEAWAPDIVRKHYELKAKERIENDPQYRAHMYRTSLPARKAIQARVASEIKSKAKMVGGGALVIGLPWLISMLFRKKQQGAPPQQIAAIQNQIRAIQARQQPMRLGLIDRGRR